jgi:flavorubredoxin
MVSTFAPSGQRGYLPINWYLLTAKEPVLVDTGTPIERGPFLTTLRSLIEPEEIKWIFITHEEADHAGNLVQAMSIAPNARVVLPFIGMSRLRDAFELPLERVLLINPGQKFSAGDRDLGVIRPPIWDSPASQALFDAKNSVLFAADALGGFIPGPAEAVEDVPEAAFLEGYCDLARSLSPWLHLVDADKFGAHLETVRRLAPETVLSSHGVVAQRRTDWLLKALATVPAMEPWVGPNHDEVIASMPPGGAVTS